MLLEKALIIYKLQYFYNISRRQKIWFCLSTFGVDWKIVWSTSCVDFHHQERCIVMTFTFINSKQSKMYLKVILKYPGCHMSGFWKLLNQNKFMVFHLTLELISTFQEFKQLSWFFYHWGLIELLLY